MRPRQRRKLEVTFGGKLPAVTADVSATGLCAELPQVFLPGSMVDGTLKLEGRDYPFIGTVAWAEPGNPMLSVNSRVGVHFLQISEEFVTAFRSSLRHRVQRVTAKARTRRSGRGRRA